MKIIFLDIDGVMNFSNENNEAKGIVHFVEDKKLSLLKQIIDATGAYIVLSSSWRYGWRDAESGLNNTFFIKNYYKLRDKFHEFGMTFFSKTPILPGFSREMEILYWISNGEDYPIESFVVIDDEETEYSKLKDHLILTQKSEGLMPEQVEKIIDVLGRKEVHSVDSKKELNKARLLEIGINCEKGLCYFGKDESMYKKYLMNFSNEVYSEDAINRFKQGDIEGAFQAVHKLKTLIEYICIPEIDTVVHEVTETLRARKTTGVIDGLMYINLAIGEIKNALVKEFCD